jgi:hypothetical protein
MNYYKMGITTNDVNLVLIPQPASFSCLPYEVIESEEHYTEERGLYVIVPAENDIIAASIGYIALMAWIEAATERLDDMIEKSTVGFRSLIMSSAKMYRQILSEYRNTLDRVVDEPTYSEGERYKHIAQKIAEYVNESFNTPATVAKHREQSIKREESVGNTDDKTMYILSSGGLCEHLPDDGSGLYVCHSDDDGIAYVRIKNNSDVEVAKGRKMLDIFISFRIINNDLGYYIKRATFFEDFQNFMTMSLFVDFNQDNKPYHIKYMDIGVPDDFNFEDCQIDPDNYTVESGYFKFHMNV